MNNGKLEKVIKGLTICASGGGCDYSDCPYKDDCGTEITTSKALMDDVLATLKYWEVPEKSESAE